MLENLPSRYSIDYYVLPRAYRAALVLPNKAYNGSLLPNYFISLAGPTIVACYLAELRLPTDESHCTCIRTKGRKVPLGLSGQWMVII